MLQERLADIQASGCSPEEACIIAYQVVEAQRRTLDDEKRRRLSNVLLSGLCQQHWDKSKHRLLLRLTSELEEEHIAMLRWYAQSPEERSREREARDEKPLFVEMSPGVLGPTPEGRELMAVEDALMRELVSCGLLIETQEAHVTQEPLDDEEIFTGRGRVQDVAFDWSTEISPLGRALLAHLEEPASHSSS